MASDASSSIAREGSAWYSGAWAALFGEQKVPHPESSQPNIETLPLFLWLLRTEHPHLWTECEERGLTLAVPSSATIGNFSASADFESHILITEADEPGTYLTLRNQRVSIVGQELCAGQGFDEQRCVQVLGMESLQEYEDRHSESVTRAAEGSSEAVDKGAAPPKVVHLIHCSRPLVGGLSDAPDHLDALSNDAVRRMTAALRSFQELEGVFRNLDTFISDVNSTAEISEHALAEIEPSLAHYLRTRWDKCVALIGSNLAGLAKARANALTPFWSQTNTRTRHRIQAQSDAQMMEEALPALVECYIMQRVHGTVHPWFQHQCAANEARMGDLLFRLRHVTTNDCGVKPEFQCLLSEAVFELSGLAAVITPLEKLLVMKRTVRAIQSAVERSLLRRRKESAPDDPPTMATDDLVLLVVYTIIRSAPHTSSLLTEINYVKTFRFVPVSTSHLGFILSTFEVAAAWFSAKIPDLERIDLGCADGDGDDAQTTESSDEFEAVPAHMRVVPRAITEEARHRNVHGLSPASSEEEPETEEVSFWQHALFSPTKPGGDNISSSERFLSATTSFLSPTALNFGGDASAKEPDEPKPYGLVRLSRLETSIPGDIGISCSTSDNGQLPKEERANSAQLLLGFDQQSKESPGGARNGSGLNLVDAACAEGCFAVVTTRGSLLTWGVSGDHGRLGHDLETLQILQHGMTGLLKPTRVGKLLGATVAAVACGEEHMLALLTRGAVLSWGDDRWGQLGTDEKGPFLLRRFRVAPAYITTLESYQVVSIACGARHSLAATNSGLVFSWGDPRNGQLGRFSEDKCDELSRGSHPDVDGEGAASVEDEPESESSALRTLHALPGQIQCDWKFRPAPPVAPGEEEVEEEEEKDTAGAVTVEAGASHSIVITSQGAAFSFGCGLHGRLGHGGHADVFIPVQVKALAQLPELRVVQAAAGAAHSLFRTAGGAVFGCGFNCMGQVGVHAELRGDLHAAASSSEGDKNQKDGPVDTKEVRSSKSVSSSSSSSSSVLVPLRVMGEIGDLKVVNISAGRWHSVATVELPIDSTGIPSEATASSEGGGRPTQRMFVWGSNASGCLGVGRNASQVPQADEPQGVCFRTRKLSVAVAGGEHTVVFDITPEAHRTAQARRHGREGGWGGEVFRPKSPPSSSSSSSASKITKEK